MRQGQRSVCGNPVLFLRAHLAEGPVMAVRPKDRIVAKSSRPAGRKDKGPVHPALEGFDCAIRMRERQHADEGRPPRRGRSARLEFSLDAGHGRAEVSRRAGPSGRIDARRAIERLDAKPGIVGKRHEPRAARGGSSLQDGVVAKGRPCLLGLIETERGGAERLDAEGAEQFFDLAQLAGVVGGDDEAAGEAPPSLARARGFAAQRTTIL